MRTMAFVGLLLLAGCSGSMNPKVCMDTTALPTLPGMAKPADPNAPTTRCGGFAFAVSLGDPSSAEKK